nr:MAG TPA: hypothetical protein [Caudoviricetes sp.]
MYWISTYFSLKSKLMSHFDPNVYSTAKSELTLIKSRLNRRLFCGSGC